MRVAASRGRRLISLRIRHTTLYQYRDMVSLGPHRLMLRPRESRDLRLISSELTISPAATVTWANDAFGNAIATASFQGMSDTLSIENVAELYQSPLPATGMRAGLAWWLRAKSI